MPDLIDTLTIVAEPGKVVGDFQFQLYLNGTQQSAAGLSITEVPVDAYASIYTVEGRPDVGAGEQWTITWNTGTQTGVQHYPVTSGQPTYFILPLRQPGVVLADLGVRLLLDGELELTTGDIALASIGDYNDYALTALPYPPTGSIYSIVYSWSGAYHQLSWPSLVSGVNVGIPAYRSIISDLAEFMVHTIIATPITRDAYGDEVSAGAPLNIRCYIEGGRRMVQDFKGAQVVSKLMVVLFGVYGVEDHDYRWTLPAGFGPSTPRRALSVDVFSDENGPHHEVVYF